MKRDHPPASIKPNCILTSLMYCRLLLEGYRRFLLCDVSLKLTNLITILTKSPCQIQFPSSSPAPSRLSPSSAPAWGGRSACRASRSASRRRARRCPRPFLASEALSVYKRAGGSVENALELARVAFRGHGRGKPPDGTLEEVDLPAPGLGYDILPADDLFLGPFG